MKNAILIYSICAGEPSALLPIFHHVLLAWSPLLARWLATHGYELTAKKDSRFMEAVYRLLLREFRYKPALNRTQFFTTGFVERKIMLCCDAIEILRGKVAELEREANGYRARPKPVVAHEAAVPAEARAEVATVTEAMEEATARAKAGLVADELCAELDIKVQPRDEDAPYAAATHYANYPSMTGRTLKERRAALSQFHQTLRATIGTPEQDDSAMQWQEYDDRPHDSAEIDESDPEWRDHRSLDGANDDELSANDSDESNALHLDEPSGISETLFQTAGVLAAERKQCYAIDNAETETQMHHHDTMDSAAQLIATLTAKVDAMQSAMATIVERLDGHNALLEKILNCVSIAPASRKRPVTTAEVTSDSPLVIRHRELPMNTNDVANEDQENDTSMSSLNANAVIIDQLEQQFQKTQQMLKSLTVYSLDPAAISARPV